MITDLQIHELRRDAVASGDWDTVRTCNEALTSEVLAPGSLLDPTFATWIANPLQAEAREVCATLYRRRYPIATPPLPEDSGSGS